MKIASIESRSKVIASSRGCPCGGSAKDLKMSWHLAEAGHASTSWPQAGHVEMVGLLVLASNLGARMVWSDGVDEDT